MRFSASAPGKAVLSGEYAVLQGAPAIAMAIDCRARVTAESADGEYHSVVSPGYHEHRARFRCVERGVMEWIDDSRTHADHALLEHIWRHLKALPAQNLTLTLDTRGFFDTESTMKLGFGSSAALAAALTAVLVRAGAAEVKARATRDVLESATIAHRSFQGGRGSGVDVATAVRGGVIAFTARPEYRIQTLQWPPELRCSLMWSGKPASTVERLRKFERFERSRAARRSAARLIDASRTVVGAWRGAKGAAILESLAAYTAALRQFSIAHSLGVFDAGHQELCELADECGFVYKPCGAGGGDIGVLFALQDTSDAAFGEFSNRAGQLGFRRLDQALESAGLIYEH